MLLRASGTNNGIHYDMRAVTSRAPGDAGVASGGLLAAFVDAAMLGTVDEVREARTELVDRLGVAAMVDTASVIANFEMLNRMVDGTGMPLDAPIELATRGLRETLGVSGYGGAATLHPPSWLSRLFSPLLERLAPWMTRVAAVVIRRREARRG